MSLSNKEEKKTKKSEKSLTDEYFMDLNGDGGVLLFNKDRKTKRTKYVWQRPVKTEELSIISLVHSSGQP